MRYLADSIDRPPVGRLAGRGLDPVALAGDEVLAGMKYCAISGAKMGAEAVFGAVAGAEAAAAVDLNGSINRLISGRASGPRR